MPFQVIFKYRWWESDYHALLVVIGDEVFLSVYRTFRFDIDGSGVSAVIPSLTNCHSRGSSLSLKRDIHCEN